MKLNHRSFILVSILKYAFLEYCAPLTGFDWNETEPSMIGSCSIDTTCTIWDVAVRIECLRLVCYNPFTNDLFRL